MDNGKLLKWYKEMGVDTFYDDSPVNRAAVANQTKSTPTTLSLVSNSASSREIADKAETLADLEQAVRKFDHCTIKKTAINTVFADGKAGAKIMFIGEAPGANEDKEGIPFCGQSGKLLNNILLSISLKREDVYITNTVFWRPPGNRRPTTDEIEMCRPFVEKHVALLNPQVIILVGSTAVESLLGSKVSMHQLRDEFYEYNNIYLKQSIKTAVIFHPSYLLRQPSKKKLMWYDMLRIKQLLAN
jgi:uracil-DNA glycosylase family 4